MKCKVVARLQSSASWACFGVVLFTFLSGCASAPKTKPWGRDLCLTPSLERVKWAACRAATDPYTWVPAAGAAVFGVANDWDHQVSDWAREETPVFGSGKHAAQGGITARDMIIGATALTVVGSYSGDSQHWVFNKGKGIPVATTAAIVPQGISYWLKQTTNRDRPNGKDDLSFPSTISAEAAAYSAVARRSMEFTPMRRDVRMGLEAGFGTLTALTAWSRVESGAHYPSDVLAGIALGNFTSLFIHDVFLGPSARNFRVNVSPGPDGTRVGVGFSTEH